MQLDGWQVELQKPHVLHDERVHPDPVQLPREAPCSFELVVAQDGVHRDEHPGMEPVRVGDQASNLRDRVGRLVTRPETRAADVDGVGAVVHGLDTDVGVAGRGEQFEVVAQHGAH